MQPKVGRSHVAAAVTLALAASLAAAGRPPGVVAKSGDRITGEITAGDSDAFAVDLGPGSSFGVALKASPPLAPSIRAFDPTGAEVDVAAFVKGLGGSAPKLKATVPAAGRAGAWRLLVESPSGATGTYTATFSAKHPAAVSRKAVAVPAGGTTDIEFVADLGSTLSSSIVEKSGGPVGGVSLVGPSGAPEGGGGTFTRKKTKLTLAPLVAASGFGTYTLRITGGATAAVVDVSAKVKFAKVAKRKATLPAEASFTSLTPNGLRQGDAAVALTAAGSNIAAGTEFAYDAAGLTVSNVVVDGPSSARLDVAVADDAPFGVATLVAYPPPLLGEPALVGASTVRAPLPAVSGVSPASMRQLETGVVLTVTGTGFRDGGALSLSGAGVTVGATAVLSPTQAEATLTAVADASFGARDVTFTQPAAGGGDSATKTGSFTVYAPDPVLASVSISEIRQGAAGIVMTLTGNHFRDGANVSIPGGGITVSNLLRASDTTMNVTLTADAAAPFGLRNVSYMQPPLGGGAATTLDAAITVKAPVPTIASVSPATLRQGESTTLTVDGTGFRSGGAVSVSSPSGLSVGATTFVSATRVTVLVGVDADAAFDLRDVTYTQPAAGGGDAVTRPDAFVVAAPVPTVTGVSPSFATQGDGSVLVTVTGTGFRAGGAISFSASGISGGATTVDGATSASVTVAVASDATLGAHDVTFTQSAAAGGASGTSAGAFLVRAPVPTVTNVSPAQVRQGQTDVVVTVTGTNFRSGGAITVSGTGLTLGATTFGSATSASVPVTVAADAAFGARDVTWTQPAAGGGGAATLAAALAVAAPDPTIASVSPVQAVQGTSGTLTVDGTNFRSGFALSAGAGVALSNLVLVSATQVEADYAVDAAATPGPRDVTYTHAAIAGGASVTKTAAFLVRTPAPTVSSISPSLWLPGDANFAVRVVGTGFNAGTTVSASGAGVVVVNTSSGSPDTEMLLRVSVASAAAVGARDVTITPGAGGGPAAGFTGLATIAPADPVVTSVSHVTMAQGAQVAVIVSGQNFRNGDQFSFSGSGLSIASQLFASSTSLVGVVNVAVNAATGPRSVTVTHAAAEGGRAATLANAFSVVAASPTVASISPSSIGVTSAAGLTRQVPVTISGTNFMTGAALSVTKAGGSGVSVVANSATVVSATTLRATLAVTSAATTGAWDLLVTNPGGVGTSGSSGNALLNVNSASTRTVNAVVAASGSTWGGERVTVYGAGFAAGDVVDFGSVRALATQVLDTNTIVTTVPPPAAASRTAATAVNVTVRANGGAGASATLANGWSYAKDDNRLVVRSTFPAQGATNVPGNLKRVAVLLSGPCDTTTAPHGTVNASNALWFDPTAGLDSSGRAFGPLARWLVLVRSSGMALPTDTDTVNVPTALTSLAGTSLTPTRLGAAGGSDQYTFGVVSGTTDAGAPTLSAIVPADTSASISRMTRVVLTFSEEIDPLTVTTANITFTQSGTTVPASIELASDLRTVTLTPHAQLLTNTTYTTTVTTSVLDMCGNAVASSLTRTFTTRGATDLTAPSVDAVVVERLSGDLDGSGTYVNSSGTPGNAFDSFLPLNGFLLDVRFSDEDSGVDESQFSAKTSTFLGINPPNTELASNFTITATGATWRLPSGTNLTAGENVTFTFLVKDRAGITSSSKVVTFDLVGKDTTCTGQSATGHGGGDHDPFDARRTWVIRADLDAYTVTYSGSGATSGAVTTAAADNVNDLEQSLRYAGLGTGSMTAAAASTVNGTALGTNAIVRRLFLERYRALLRARYGIGEDGTRTADSVDVEFLLPGEQGSLASLPTFSAADSYSSGNAYSELSIGGTFGPEAIATGTSSVLGQAWIDERNLYEEANLNTGGASVDGVFLLGMFKLNLGAPSTSTWRVKVMNRFMTGFAGAVPVGEGGDDDDVLAGSFDRTSAGNSAAQNARYDAILDAIECAALYASAVGAHEAGHSHGLVPDGAPKTGLFGNAHYANTFTEATSVSPNTSGHLDAIGNDVMSASTSLESAVLTGSDFKRFSGLDIAHLLNRLFFDEGR